MAGWVWDVIIGYLVPDVNIEIRNDMPSNAHSLYLHCKSEKDDRLGEHWLAKGQHYRWEFKIEPVKGTTRYNCYMKWGNYKKKWFLVYRGSFGTDDWWYSVRQDGVYATQDGPSSKYKKIYQW
ncbi:hypothetical protein Dsin_016360 [Dipteronia sinensis]|uniref:S-protein homolog n=1 Tax=Dipteronia sinensis TaxID=43782 RepID=A0AAE0E5J9_9ROSI|nr:hypothetical protein Dsin_016360 [Dipteronia sinensis]